ncbi:hypothetical protein [Streptomyces murinus]|uniref:hypothetical protein n=1 Tax=Streptomyces murinus TaxID=33900 RepID=UPI0038301AC0
MERAQERPGGQRVAGRAPEPVDLELLVHGVGGTTPEEMLGDARTVRVAGDDTAAVFRRAEDVSEDVSGAGAGPRGVPGPRGGGGPVQEAYVWYNLTSGDAGRALWLLLLPFMVVNLAHWMRPAAPARARAVRLYGLLVRLIALTLTVLLVAAACEVALDLVAWQCAGARGCARRHFWLAFLTPDAAQGPGVRRWAELLGTSGGWWAQPGRRLALAALVPGGLILLLWYLSHRTWSAYESHRPLVQGPDPAPDPDDSALARPGFWYGRRLVARLRAAHTAAGLLTVAAALATPAVRFDHRPGGPGALDTLGRLLTACLLAGAGATVAAVCRRGRDEHRVDQRLDPHLLRPLPLGALALLLLTALYTGWSRPDWHSSGRLPGAPAFDGLMLAQGVLVVVLGVVAWGMYRRTVTSLAPAAETDVDSGSVLGPGPVLDPGSGPVLGIGSGPASGPGFGSGVGSGPERGPGPGPGRGPDSDPAPGPGSGPGSGSGLDLDRDRERAPDRGPSTGPCSRLSRDPDFGPGSYSGTGPGSGSGPDFSSGRAPGLDSDPDLGTGPGPGLGPGPGTDLGPDVGPGPGPSPRSDPDLARDLGADPGPGLDRGPDLSSSRDPGAGLTRDPGLGPGTDLGPDVGPGPGPSSRSDPDVARDFGAGPGSGPGPGLDRHPDLCPGLGPGTDLGPDVGPGPGPSSRSDPDLTPDLGTGSGPGPGLDRDPDLSSSRDPGAGLIRDPDLGPGPGTDLGPDVGPGPGPSSRSGHDLALDLGAGPGPDANLRPTPHPRPTPSTHGLGGPAAALVGCVLGGVMSGGVAQRVADWLDGAGGAISGPPVVLTWQASMIPPLLAVLLGVAVRLAAGTARLARAERDRVRREHPGEPEDPARTRAIAHARAMAALTDRAPLVLTVLSAAALVLGGGALAGALVSGRSPDGAAGGTAAAVRIAAGISQGLGSWLVGLGFLLFVTWGRRAYKDRGARRTVGILWDVGTFWPRAAHPFAPPCYAERAVPDLTWRMATWTEATGGRLVLSGHSQGSVLAAAAAWQLTPATRARIALLTYGSPLERLYGRWFPAHFGPAALAGLHRDVACWHNLYRRTDPIGGPVCLPADGQPPVDRPPLQDPLAYGRTPEHPLPTPILGHSCYRSDPAFAQVRADLLTRLHTQLPAPRGESAI